MLISSQDQGLDMETRDYHGYTVYEDGVVVSPKTGRPMNPCDNGRGYLITAIRINGKSRTKAIHRIVAEAFIPNPEELSDVDHIDGDKRNNHVSNLRWVTHGDNIKHCYTLQNRSATGENNARCKTKESQVRDICKLILKGIGPTEISKRTGVALHIVGAIKSGKNWRTVSKDYW